MTGRGSNDRYNAVLDGQGQIHYMHKSAIAHAWRMAWLFVVTPTCTCSSLGFLVEKNNSKQKKDEKKEIVRNEKKIKRTYDYVNALDFVCASDCEYGGGRGLISMQKKKCSTIYNFILWFPIRLHHLFKNHNICKIFVRRTEMGLLDRVNWYFSSLQEVTSEYKPLSMVKNCFYFTNFELQSCVCVCIIIGLSSTDIERIQAYRTLYISREAVNCY